ncbi:carbon storage regulator [Nitrosococcus halophilus Nc 4]|uniref:Translational regulator CsrA n=1 Tax=Nitrosococcus halophilus (strain Nc4) TaxID=472759 RepID=D5BYY6_NITHN|nr:carbon storage regulator [Nitrosococcus halophilus Nc 4]
MVTVISIAYSKAIPQRRTTACIERRSEVARLHAARMYKGLPGETANASEGFLFFYSPMPALPPMGTSPVPLGRIAALTLFHRDLAPEVHPFIFIQPKEKTMLVLTRRSLESIVIGQDIQLTVLEIHGGQVRIGIKAPKTTPIVREEAKNKHPKNRSRSPVAGAIHSPRPLKRSRA